MFHDPSSEKLFADDRRRGVSRFASSDFLRTAR
jgi:hypothetical protein